MRLEKGIQESLKNHSQEYKKRAEPVFTGYVNKISYQFLSVRLLYKGKPERPRHKSHAFLTFKKP